MGWLWVDLLYKIWGIENNQPHRLIVGWCIYIQPVAYIVLRYIYIYINLLIYYNWRVVFAKHKDWLEPINMFYVCYVLVVAKYPLIINIDDSSCWCRSHAVSTLLIYAGYIIYWFNTNTPSQSSHSLKLPGRWQWVHSLATLTIDRPVAAGLWSRHSIQLPGRW